LHVSETISQCEFLLKAKYTGMINVPSLDPWTKKPSG